jgi:hypothetical protein
MAASLVEIIKFSGKHRLILWAYFNNKMPVMRSFHAHRKAFHWGIIKIITVKKWRKNEPDYSKGYRHGGRSLGSVDPTRNFRVQYVS